MARIRYNRTYTLQFRRNAVALVNRLNLQGTVTHNYKRYKSLRALALGLGIQDESVLRSWMHKDWSKERYQMRVAARGRKSKLNEEEEEDIEKWIREQCEQGNPTTIETIQIYIQQTYSWLPTPSWVSKFCTTRKIRSHVIQKKPAKRLRDSIAIEIEDFRNKINTETAKQKRSRRRRTRVWHVDEKGLWDDDVRTRGYSPVGTTAYQNTPNSHHRDTIVACVADDGTKLQKLMYIKHKPKKYQRAKNIE